MRNGRKSAIPGRRAAGGTEAERPLTLNHLEYFEHSFQCRAGGGFRFCFRCQQCAVQPTRFFHAMLRGRVPPAFTFLKPVPFQRPHQRPGCDHRRHWKLRCREILQDMNDYPGNPIRNLGDRKLWVHFAGTVRVSGRAILEQVIHP